MEQRKERITMRVTAAEKEEIRSKAAAEHLTVTAYLMAQAQHGGQDLSLAAVKRAVMPVIDELVPIGRNINQLAKVSNALGRADRHDLVAVIQWLLGSLMHIVPKAELVRLVEGSEPCGAEEART